MEVSVEIEKLRSENTALQIQLKDEKINLQTQLKDEKIKQLEEKIKRQEVELELRNEQFVNQRLQFDIERATWTHERPDGEPPKKVARPYDGEPPAKVARSSVAPNPKRLSKLSRELFMYRLHSTCFQDFDPKIHMFLDRSIVFDEQDVFRDAAELTSGHRVAAELANGCAPSKNGRYRAIGIEYDGPCISAMRLRKLAFIKEAYGIEIGGTQYLLVVLFQHKATTMDRATNLMGEVVPIQPKRVSVFTEGPATDDGILRNLKQPSGCKWMFLERP